jgi:hypothetical protein
LILQNPIGQNPNEIILTHLSLPSDFVRLQRAMHEMSSLGHGRFVKNAARFVRQFRQDAKAEAVLLAKFPDY